ncbi:hypothetical protein [Psychromicrobium sp. YIM B11713]|uniref:hypothetical protein n=1 Tax=Psychromicrobium sp. YIM B11713 TaxID=3145233 RepID=UPI00374FD9EF
MTFRKSTSRATISAVTACCLILGLGSATALADVGFKEKKTSVQETAEGQDLNAPAWDGVTPQQP